MASYPWIPAPAGPLEPKVASARHEALIDSLIRAGDLQDPRVIGAMRKVQRHLFVPPMMVQAAYDNTPLPIGQGQTISQPTIVAIMTEALCLGGSERVLEIGTGSGYQAAILSLVCAEVFSIEVIPELGREVRARLTQLGYPVHVRIGNGYEGWPEEAPFDRIVITAAPPEIPSALVDQLTEGGLFVTPVGAAFGAQRLVRGKKIGRRLEMEDLGGVSFVPMVDEVKEPSWS